MSNGVDLKDLKKLTEYLMDLDKKLLKSEDIRKVAEEARIKAEEARLHAEEARKIAEEARMKTEQLRQDIFCKLKEVFEDL